jgi:ankyrin repeat protein
MKTTAYRTTTLAACIFVGLGFAADPAAAQGGPRRPAAGSTSIVPQPGAPDPAPFTLKDRFFDAARRGDLRMLKLCVDKGVEAGAVDEVGRSALLMAVRDAGSLEAVQYLRGLGLDVNTADAQGRTALGDAAAQGRTELVDYLVREGADVHHKDAQGQTPLYNAVLGGGTDSVARLLQAKADVDVRDRYGDTPLMGACAKGHEDIARLLVEAGADTTVRDQEGRTAAQRAHEDGHYCRTLDGRDEKAVEAPVGGERDGADGPGAPAQGSPNSSF